MKKVLIYILVIVLTASSVYAADPTPVLEEYKVSCYLKTDSNAGNSGFKVYLTGCNKEGISDENGYFEVVGYAVKNTKLNIRIKRDNHLTRNIDFDPIGTHMLMGSAQSPLETWAGDVNNDYSINMSDIVILAGYVNSSRGDGKYSESVDINGDGAVNMSDVVIIAKNFNKTSSDYIMPQISIDSHPSVTPAPTPVTKNNNIMIPYAHFSITPGNNIVFCPTFQMAWNKLKEFNNGDIILIDKPLLADYLNNGFDWSDSLAEDSYLAEGGKADIIDDINNKLKEKFGEDAPTIEDVDPGKYIFYAFLLKKIKFATAFVDTDPIVFKDSNGNTESVKSFGIREDSFTKYKDHAKQVMLFDYKNDDDFIIKLLPEVANEEIILAKVKPEDTLYNTYTAVMNRINNSASSNFDLADTIRIPELDLNMEKEYGELHGIIAEGRFKDYRIEKAYQNIKFNLNKEGAKLASEGIIIVATPGTGPKTDTSKHLVFDKQYMICLKQKDAQNPYLLVWVDNANILVKSAD